MRRRTIQIRCASVLLGVAGLGATGCALGERPSLAETPIVAGESTGDPLIDEVLRSLDTVADAVFTAQYRAAPTRSGSLPTTVTVAQSSPTLHSVTVGDTRFITVSASTRTCTVSTATCEEGLDAARISDSGVTTPDLFFGGFATRLRRGALAKVGESASLTTTLGGQLATCVDVRVAAGTEQYCVLDNGVIASYVGGDVTIELLSYSPTADQSLLAFPA